MTLVWSQYNTLGSDSSNLVINSIGFSPILTFVSLDNSSSIFLVSYSFLIISILFASILEISSTPLTISSKLSDATNISFTSALALSGISLLSFNELLKPTIALRGVLISCDILLKKSVFALFAFSAWSFAILSSFINFKSGFSIVLYIKIVTNVSAEVTRSNDGFEFWTISTIVPITIKTNNGIYFFFFIFFMFLNVKNKHIIKHIIDTIETKSTLGPYEYKYLFCTLS